MKTSDFYFDLPEHLIAQHPPQKRCDARLLVYQRATQEHAHAVFGDLINYLHPGDLLVFNDTRVIKARLYGHKASGGRVEILVDRILNTHDFWAHIKASKAPRSGTVLHFGEGWQVEVLRKEADLYLCRAASTVETLLDSQGHVPLPLYIRRADSDLDGERYQTVYAKHKGSVAAPTAGLHFDEEMLVRLSAKGVELAYTTLHVGAGTFQPVRCEDVQDHVMHTEWFSVSESLCQAVSRARARGGRVIAVGTTALRALESAAVNGQLQACQRDTHIFIKPGYSFQICDGLLTNFHVPGSTLLMLVAAWIGHAPAMALYREAVAKGYRFFSYGDASLLL